MKRGFACSSSSLSLIGPECNEGPCLAPRRLPLQTSSAAVEGLGCGHAGDVPCKSVLSGSERAGRETLAQQLDGQDETVETASDGIHDGLSAAAYNRGCRCDLCRAAARARSRRHREKLKSNPEWGAPYTGKRSK